MKKTRKPKKTAQQDLPPFFDRLDNPTFQHFPSAVAVDGTPVPPVLSSFDRDILKICGNLGDRVYIEDFQALLRAYPQVLQQIQAAVNGEIFAGRNTPAEFLADLTEIWFKLHGFEHVFCGNIRHNELKGMHYVGRYLQLQEQGLAGKLPNNHQQEETIEGAVYTIGVLLKYGSRVLVDRRTGYALITDAAELLIAATQAFKTKVRPNSVCIFPVIDAAAGQTYSAVLVKQDQAIVTFYPDATPTERQC